jgi:hypothetical protein
MKARTLLLAVAAAAMAMPLAAPPETSAALHYTGSVRAIDRSAIRSAIGSGRPAARSLLSDAAGAHPISVSTHAAPRWISMMRVRSGAVELDFSRAHLHVLPGRARNQTLWHEAGHAVDLLLLSRRDDEAFSEAFRRSANWRSCFGFAGTCLDQDEVFAEQFAYWATGDRVSRSSYRIPPLMGPVTFGRLLAGTGVSTDEQSWRRP